MTLEDNIKVYLRETDCKRHMGLKLAWGVFHWRGRVLS
jgi:hypothetical protein